MPQTRERESADSGRPTRVASGPTGSPRRKRARSRIFRGMRSAAPNSHFMKPTGCVSCSILRPGRANSTPSRPRRATKSPPCSWPAAARPAPRLRQRAPLPRGFEAAGVIPTTAAARGSGEVPVHHQDATCATPIRSAWSPCRTNRIARIHASSGTTGKPTVVAYTAGRPRHVGRRDGALDPGGRRRRA